MPRHSEATLAAIKNAVDIVALVGEYLPLHRTGSKFKALCPFHDDHNPSLELNPERQSFKCWSCGAGGDVFDFVKDYERVEFPEALRMLAERAGVALENPSAADGAAGAVEDRAARGQRLGRAGVRRGPGQCARGAGLSGGAGDLGARASSGSGSAIAPEARDWLTSRARKHGYTIDAAGAGGAGRPRRTMRRARSASGSGAG